MSSKNKFGTFGGVFTPSILTILGVIMYLRLPTIVGEAGLYGTLAIILAAHVISLATGLSVASIATDKKVEAGGTYYMISRSLGLPIGGTLGLALFLGLSCSVSLYLIGFAESVLHYFGYPADAFHLRIVGSAALVLVATITLISTSLAIKAQYFIMAAIVLSLLSVFSGYGQHNFAPQTPHLSAPESTMPLMVLFGIFFPAVTGFEAGVSMSGDLKNSRRAIPKGTIWAILVGLLVYIGLAVFFSYTVNPALLLSDGKVLYKIAWMPELVAAGIWGATLSSALGSILGAPRILQATAIDRITPSFLAKGHGPSQEPRRALLLTCVLAEAGILVGELDTVARIVSVFFITTYAFLNLSCAFEGWSSADFRPSFRVPTWVSLLGAGACLIVMLQLDPLAMLGAVLLLGALYFHLQRKAFSLESGDAWSGVWASLVKSGLERLKREQLHRRNWRPNILLFSGGTSARPHLVEMGQAMAAHLGMLSDFELVPGKKPLLVRQAHNRAGATQTRYFKHAYECQDIYDSIEEISRVYGFGSMEPNTILMGWTSKPSHRESFVGLLRAFKQADYNACFLHYRQSRQFGEHEKIDLWWTGKGRNLSLAISLLRYVTASGKWRHAHIRLLVAHAEQLPGMQVQRQLEAILDSYRVQMEICLVNNTIERLPLPELIAQESGGSDLTLVGIPDAAYQDGLEEFVRSFQAVLPQMGATLFIHAASSFEEWQLSIPSAQPASAAPVPASPLPLPDLVPFRHFVIQEDLRQADRYGQQLAEAFFLQSTAGLFKALQEMGEESTNWMQQLSQSLLQASQQPEAYRRKKAVDKLRNSSYFRVNALLEKLPMATVGQQLDEAVQWYLGQLDKMVARFPMQVSLSHEAAEIAPSPSDSWAVKRLKWRYRTIALFRGGKVRVQLQYRNAAAWHIGYQQRELLANYIHALFFDGLRLLSAWRDLLAYPENTLETLLPAVIDGTLDPADVQAMQAAWQEKQASFLQELRLQEEIYRMRLLVACRENLNQMGNMLCSPLAKREIARLQAPQERVQWLDGTLATYRELWGKQLVRYANKISLEWAIISLRGRMATLLHGFQEDIGYLVQRRYGKELQQLEQSIRQLAEGGAMHEVRMPDVHLLADAFEKQERQLEALLEALPERMEVLEATAATDLEDGEAVSIPVARMTAHFLESQLVQPIKQAVEQLASQAAKSLYAGKDQAHLAKFHLDNQELEATAAAAKAIKALEQEAEHLAQAQAAFQHRIAQCLEGAFEPLSATKIVSSAKDFSQYLREYQSKKVLSGAGRLLKLGEELLRRQTAQLLYSQSKGKLLAKRLTEDQAPGLQAGRLLDFSEQYAPSAKVLEQLPNYYASLFSGRSQIDEDFWVPRPEEEALFKKAVKRYRQGMRGAIMLLGSRNAGKSILARTCIDRFYGGKTIQIFPLPEGSPRAQDLAEALRQATGLSGSPDEVLQALPQGTALLVHDLELWWERAPQGWEALELLKRLVNQYAHRCLFVFNTNPSAYQLMRAGLQLDALFIQVISCQPFNASELQQLVMLRHQSSGLGLSLRKKRPGIGFADWRMARAFNQLFNLSGGNPGAALSLWLASIRKVKDQSLHIELPKVPSSQDWKSLDEEHWRWLAQLALHKRMTLPRLQAVLQLPEDTAFELLQGLLRTGLVRERQRGVYMLAEHLDHYLIRILKTRELI